MRKIRCFLKRLKARLFPPDDRLLIHDPLKREEYVHEHEQHRLEDDGCGSHPFHEAHPPIEFDETDEEDLTAILLAEEEEGF